jgi:hypothetical protein
MKNQGAASAAEMDRAASAAEIEAAGMDGRSAAEMDGRSTGQDLFTAAPTSCGYTFLKKTYWISPISAAA